MERSCCRTFGCGFDDDHSTRDRKARWHSRAQSDLLALLVVSMRAGENIRKASFLSNPAHQKKSAAPWDSPAAGGVISLQGCSVTPNCKPISVVETDSAVLMICWRRTSEPERMPANQAECFCRRMLSDTRLGSRRCNCRRPGRSLPSRSHPCHRGTWPWPLHVAVKRCPRSRPRGLSP